MSNSSWNQTIVNLKNELASIKGRAEEISNRFQMLGGEAESLKIEFLQQSLEKQRGYVARCRGVVSLTRDKKKIGTILAVAAGGFILDGLITKNKYAALNTGMSGLDGALRRYGEAEWAVSLGKEVIVTPEDRLPSKGTWVTLESLKKAMEGLKAEAFRGQQLGNLDNVIHKLEQSRKLVYFGIPTTDCRLSYTQE